MGVKTHRPELMITLTKCGGPLFLHRKTDHNARLKKSPARRVLDTFFREKVSGESFPQQLEILRCALDDMFF